MASAVSAAYPAKQLSMFREETGRTFSNYILDYRINYASYLLKESSGPIGDIAMECGFNNFSYFIRTFRKHFGVSPRQYRQKM